MGGHSARMRLGVHEKVCMKFFSSEQTAEGALVEKIIIQPL